MAGQLRDFLSSISRYGVSKTSHYLVSIPVLSNDEKFSDIQRVLGLRCEATELPGRQIVSNDSRTYGPTYKTPYQSVYQEITLNFLETGSFVIRGFFESWMSSIYNPENNILQYPQAYRYPVTLTQYDVTDTAPGFSVAKPQVRGEGLAAIAVWTMHKAFPTAINQMPVAWSEDGLHRVSVTLAYEWYTLGTVGVVKLAQPPSGSAPVPPKGSSQS